MKLAIDIASTRDKTTVRAIWKSHGRETPTRKRAVNLWLTWRDMLTNHPGSCAFVTSKTAAGLRVDKLTIHHPE